MLQIVEIFKTPLFNLFYLINPLSFGVAKVKTISYNANFFKNFFKKII